MSDEQQPMRTASSQADNLSRRQWLLRLGEMVVLAGVSGLVPESAAALLGADTSRVTSRCRSAARPLRRFARTSGSRAEQWRQEVVSATRQ